jgi:DNA repair protein RecN (Recombination protein N)
MLTHIHIRNYAIVDSLDLEFGEGMSALTGETGAGKSILLDALNLCLGDRADTDVVRPGADKAELTAGFRIAADGEAAAWLEEHELATGEADCLLRRVIQQGGRSKGFINGSPVPLQMMRELGEFLVDIHGQHAHQSLFRRDAQREALDGFGGHHALLHAVAERYRRLADIQTEIQALEGGQTDYQSRLDLLRFQVDELAALKLGRQDILELDAEQRRLAAAGDLIQTAQQILASLYEEEPSAQSALSHAASDLERLLRIDPNLREPQELIASALIQLEEGCDGLRRYVESLDLDPERLAQVEQQISTLNDLARKHRVRPEDLPERLEVLSAELAALENAEGRLAALREDLDAGDREYRKAASALSKARSDAAATLSSRVTGFIRELGMPGAEFLAEVAFVQDGKPTRHGLDQVEFLVRTNPGQPMGSLNRIASGGELSRIGLAIQVATANSGRIPTLIFDEADVGIGGAVAEVVGRQLRELGESRQVLCVTHLPQVAAQAHGHYQVSKHMEGGRTFTRVTPLSAEERIDEIARMLGGVEITPQTRRHAQEMLERARGKQRAPA